MENKSGIYCFQSKINPYKIYIGSSNNMPHRKSQHFSSLRKNIHKSLKLQNHVNKYGIDDLEFFILDVCDKEKLIETEQFYLDIFDPWFNVRKIAEANYGKVISEENRKKMRDAMLDQYENGGLRERMSMLAKKRWEDDEYRDNMVAKHTGKKRTQESIEKTRQANIGRKMSTEAIRKSSEKRIGRKATEETREKNRMAMLGRKLSEETKSKISNSNKNKTVSDETRLKLSTRNTLNKQKTSIYCGVGKNRNGKRWLSKINFNGKAISIGTFDTEVEAAIAYNNFIAENNIKNKYINTIP